MPFLAQWLPSPGRTPLGMDGGREMMRQTMAFDG